MKVNPFSPNSPVNPSMFIGRTAQLTALEESLFQTRAGQPKGFMLTGERGIGKTSLLHYLKFVAQGHIRVDDSSPLNFLVIELDIDSNTTDIGLIRRIERCLNRELSESEPARTFLSASWKFLKQIETHGASIEKIQRPLDPESLHDDFAYSLATTVERITDTDATNTFGARYDGVLILIDEADNAPKALRLGAILKLLMERVQRHGCHKLMIGLAGMPSLREVLRESHPSSLRVFDELQLEPLTQKQASLVIDRALEDANERNTDRTSIDEEGRNLLISLSEGYPHFIQQFGYSAFSKDADGVINSDDVLAGALGPMGAMEKIGDRYYRDDFYRKIQKESYRQVLRIMADSNNRWVTKSDIRGRFQGKTTTLDNALHALRKRNIIIAKEDELATYRLQHRGFALWIKYFTSDTRALHGQIATTDNTGETSGPTAE